MPVTWTLTTTDHLKHAVAPTSLSMQFLDDQAGLCDLIGAPPTRHVVLQVYTAAASEEVIAYECADGAVKVVRGDTPKPWPAEACVRVVQIVDGPLCSLDNTGEDKCCAPAWDALSVCDAMVLDVTNPLAPSLCLNPTGVVSGNYCGLSVDVYGRIVRIDENFPIACLPVFDPCACAGSGSGSGGGSAPVAASDVTYAAMIGACVAVGPTVQEAIEQIDSALCALQSQAATVVVAGGGINVTSVGAVYTVALQSIGAAGTYDGITLNQYGQVTAVSLASAPTVSVTGVAPIGSLQTGPASFDVSVANASYTSYGVVKLAPAPGGSTPDPDDVVSWSVLGVWWANNQNYICSLGATGVLDPSSLPNLYLSVCYGGTAQQMSARDAMHSLGGAVAYYSNSGGTVSAYNLNATGAWSFQIPDAPARYAVLVEPVNNGPALVPVVAKTGSTFTLTWYDITNPSVVVPAGPAECSVLVFRT